MACNLRQKPVPKACLDNSNPSKVEGDGGKLEEASSVDIYTRLALPRDLSSSRASETDDDEDVDDRDHRDDRDHGDDHGNDNSSNDDHINNDPIDARPIKTSSVLSSTPIISSFTGSSTWTSTISSAIVPSNPPNTSIHSEGPASTSPVNGHEPGESSAGLGNVTGIVLGSVLGAVVAVFILLILVSLMIRKVTARRNGLKIQAHDWKFWKWEKGITRQRCREESTEYRKAELDATETGVGYNIGTPHELYVPKIGHDKLTELNDKGSPVEVLGDIRYV